MNERGFFTIVGLCLMLVVAISIKGIQEFETNYSRGITNFQIEHKLQNLADSFLVEEFENVSNLDADATYSNSRFLKEYEGLENVTVEIHAKQDNICLKNGDNTEIENLPKNFIGTIILSVASCNSPFIEGKIYRSTFAYIDDTKTVHYLISNAG